MAAADQLARRPQLTASHEYDSVSDIDEVRRVNDLRLKKRFESIFDKYERDFSEVGDVVDLRTGRIEIDNGHFRNMRCENDPGSRIRASRRVTVEDEVEQHSGRRHESSTQSLQAYPPMHQPIHQPPTQPPPPAASALPQNTYQPYQPHQPYATYQQSVVSLPVMNGMQQFNPFDPNALVSLIDQRVQSQLAQYMPPPARRTPAIEDRWRTPRRHGPNFPIRSPMPASPYTAQGRVSRSPSASSSGSRSSRSIVSSGRGSRDRSVSPHRSERDGSTELGVWEGSARDSNDEGLAAPETGGVDDEPSESLWAVSEETPTGQPRGPRPPTTPWTKSEIMKLIHLRSEGFKFRAIAEQLPGRSQRACCNLWLRLPDSKRDAHIVREQITEGPNVVGANLSQAESSTPGQSSRNQRDQNAGDYRKVFLDHIAKRKRKELRHSLHHARYTKEQDDLIMYLREVKKQPFRMIEASVPGKSAKSLANRYYDILQHQKRLPLHHPQQEPPRTLNSTTNESTDKQPSRYPPPISEVRRQSVSLESGTQQEVEERTDLAPSKNLRTEEDRAATPLSLPTVPDTIRDATSISTPGHLALNREDHSQLQEPMPTMSRTVTVIELDKNPEVHTSVETPSTVTLRRNSPQETAAREQPKTPRAIPQSMPKKRAIEAVVPDSADSEGEVSPPRAPATDIVRKVTRISDAHGSATSNSKVLGKRARVSLPARLHPADDLGSEDELGF